MKIIVLTALIALFSLARFNSLLAQEIKWEELSSAFANLRPNIYPAENNDFYECRQENGSNYIISHYNNLKLTVEKKISLLAEGKKATLLDVKGIDQNLVVFMYTQVKKNVNLYFQTFNPSGDAISEPKLLVSVSEGKNLDPKYHFTIVQSEDKSSIGLTYYIDSHTSEKESFGFKVFDSKMQLTKENVYLSEYDSDQIKMNGLCLTNKGELIAGFHIYGKDPGKSFPNYNEIKFMYHFILQNDEFEYDVDLGEEFGYEFSSFAYDNKLECMAIVGRYNAKDSEDGDGNLFCVKIDLKEKKVGNPNMGTFTKEFILDENTHANTEVEKEANRDKTVYCDLRKIFFTTDGEVVIQLEDYDKRTVTRRNSKGEVWYDNYFTYGDIVLAKWNDVNGFDWVSRISRKQDVMGRDTYCGTVGTANQDKYFCYYNDNSENYSESGDYNVSYEEMKVMDEKCNKRIVRVEMNLNSGTFERKALTYDGLDETILRPDFFLNNSEEHTAIVLASSKSKQKLGLVKY